jgi:diguanylate cyclase (GGDEF)-like protein
MGDGLRTIRVLTTDDSLVAQARAALHALDGWEIVSVATPGELLAAPPALGDVVLVDKWIRGRNVYELLRELTGRTRCRTFVVGDHDERLGESIARFCGATGIIRRPLAASRLRAALDEHPGPRPERPQDRRGKEGADDLLLPEALLVDIATSRPDASLVEALTDPETSLFNYAFLNYKLDEEYKRAVRFGHPLSCVMLGFEGQASDDVLRCLAGIFLSASRDTDVLGRFDESSFLFLLPNTGPDGARIMAQRVADRASDEDLRDLVGDPLTISVGISDYPHPQIRRREDLYARARDAFVQARAAGGGVVASR